jgi:lysophospholipase L1-like esterase
MSVIILALIFLTVAIIVSLFRERTKNLLERKKQTIINVSLLIAVLIFFFLSGEIILRILLKDETSLYGFGPASLKFNQKYVSLNNDGMRDRNFPIEKLKNTIRIAAIGDSFTFGAGIKNVNDTYPKVLDRELNLLNRSNKYEVMNFGIPGYDTLEELKCIKNKALKYKPDIIIMGFVFNDLSNIDPRIKAIEERIEIPYLGFWLRDISYFYYFLESRVNKLIENIKLKKKYDAAILETYNSSINQNYTRVLYREISNISQQNNITVVMLVFPAMFNLKEYPWTAINDFAREIAKENNFYVVDLLNDYKREGEEKLRVNKYDAHPNELGQKIAADKILEMFINKSL